MKTTTITFGLRILAIMLGLSFATQVFGKHYHYTEPSSHLVKIEYAPVTDLSLLGLSNTQNQGFSAMLRVPLAPIPYFIPLAFGGDNDGDDTSGDNDSDGGHGHHGHHGDNDTDSTGADNDTTGGFGDNDSTGHGDRDSIFSGNDTIDCGGHGHHQDDDDTTGVNDSLVHPMFGNGTQSITVKSYTENATVILQFTNNLSKSVTITNIKLASGFHFGITSGGASPARPIKLTPGEQISVKLAYTSSDMNLHADQLQIISNGSAVASNFSLQGMRLTPSAVTSPNPTGVLITMAPNPMTSRLKVDLTGVSSAAVQIYNISGRQVLSSTISSSEWLWNGEASDGTSLRSGTYIVRVNGTSIDGTPFASTQKIILQQ